MGKYSLNKTPLDLLSEIAFKVKVLRKEQSFSQSVLAQKSGVSLASLRRFEQTGQISFESLLKILHVLGRLGDLESILEIKQGNKDVEILFSSKTRG
ncbi:MAG: helix-turn-helix domain-containing protein [Vicingaceae bacterium]